MCRGGNRKQRRKNHNQINIQRATTNHDKGYSIGSRKFQSTGLRGITVKRSTRCPGCPIETFCGCGMPHVHMRLEPLQGRSKTATSFSEEEGEPTLPVYMAYDTHISQTPSPFPYENCDLMKRRLPTCCQHDGDVAEEHGASVHGVSTAALNLRSHR